METFRKYGNPPFGTAILHGGPGAPGQVAPVARELSKRIGIIEPIQNESSVDGQVEELRRVLENNATAPITLIGHSWGAMLAFLFTSKYSNLVKKLILISSAIFEESDAEEIMKRRFDRFKDEDKIRIIRLLEKLNDPELPDKNNIFRELGELATEVDSYDLEPGDNEIIEYQYDIYKSVWEEAAELRSNGKILEMGKQIKCPVIAFHGDHDCHPAESIDKRLSSILPDFKFILLEKCGHYPWLEKHAKDKFYKILSDELDSSTNQ